MQTDDIDPTNPVEESPEAEEEEKEDEDDDEELKNQIQVVSFLSCQQACRIAYTLTPSSCLDRVKMLCHSYFWARITHSAMPSDTSS